MYFIHENVEKIENKNPDAHARIEKQEGIYYLVYTFTTHTYT